MKKFITFTVLCIGAMTVLSGCLKDKEQREKAKQEKRVKAASKSKELIEREIV